MDGQTFNGGGGTVTLTADEVSGLTLISTYHGTDQPVNTLKVTASNTAEVISSIRSCWGCTFVKCWFQFILHRSQAQPSTSLRSLGSSKYVEIRLLDSRQRQREGDCGENGPVLTEKIILPGDREHLCRFS
jgi:hypothetical protein